MHIYYLTPYSTAFFIQITYNENFIQKISFKRPAEEKEISLIGFTSSKKENDLPKFVNQVVNILDLYFYDYKINNSLCWNHLKLHLGCFSSFRQDLFEELCKTKMGETLTYSELGNRVGSRAYQAIGGALRSNPFPILIPCHRVVSKKNIGGFMGKTNENNWELRIKKILILHDKKG